MINVTKTFLPPLSEYTAQLERVWKNEWLTNRGELVLELEEKLKDYLAVSDILIMNNGTIPIQIALKLLAKGGEVITTPFSYVATTSAILWENCTPVFVDIHQEYWTIDESKIEAAITEKTTCILATHVFGNPCHVEEIERIAIKYGLKVIYDAAHCFGVKYKGRSIFEYGDVSTCSFHATKVFHTGEGGASFCRDKDLQHQIFYSHNFGHNGPLDFHGLGINGKISELQAALGLAVLPHIGGIMDNRKRVVDAYDSLFGDSEIEKLKLREQTDWNYSYYPVLFRDEEVLLKVESCLKQNKINARRYFHPSLNTLHFVKKLSMPISENIASRVLCLPLYPGLETDNIETIAKLVNSVCV